jgi:hypothetical protein
VDAPKQEGRILLVEAQTSSVTAQGADGRTFRIAGTRGPLTGLRASNEEILPALIGALPISVRTRGLSGVMSEEARLGITAIEDVKACHPPELAAVAAA